MHDKYAGLRDKLKDTRFPHLYMFKFMIPNVPELIEKVKFLAKKGTKFNTKLSKNDKYITI
jgi:hypothetical protein